MPKSPMHCNLLTLRPKFANPFHVAMHRALRLHRNLLNLLKTSWDAPHFLRNQDLFKSVI